MHYWLKVHQQSDIGKHGQGDSSACNRYMNVYDEEELLREKCLAQEYIVFTISSYTYYVCTVCSSGIYKIHLSSNYHG